jgi:hypothetical protein
VQLGLEHSSDCERIVVISRAMTAAKHQRARVADSVSLEIASVMFCFVFLFFVGMSQTFITSLVCSSYTEI